MKRGWVTTHCHAGTRIESRGGVDWADAGLPPRWHRCRPHSRGWTSLGYAERCRCGASRGRVTGPWAGRNETRNARARKRREARLPVVQVTCRSCRHPYDAPDGTPLAKAEECTGCWFIRFLAAAQEPG
jgi:hypothetical protein